MDIVATKFTETREYDQGVFTVNLSAQEAHDLWTQFEALRETWSRSPFELGPRDGRFKVSAQLQALLADHIAGMHIAP